MTEIDTTWDGKQRADVIVTVPQPTVPSTARPADVGLVEISTSTIRGSIWFTGSGAPLDPGQQTGDMYLDTDTGDIYQWDGDSWEFQATFAPSTDTPAEILAKLVTVDGAGSALDADLLDGQHGAYYATQMDMGMAQSNITNNASAIAAIQTEQTTQNTAISNNTTAITTETTNRTNADTTLQNNINLKANIASPVFTGDPQAPTPATADNDTSIATTAYVKANLAALPPSGIPEAPNDGLTYGRKSLAWAAVVGGATLSDNPPSSPQVGQMWVESDTGNLFTYWADANSSQWVQINVPGASNYVQKTGDTMSGALTINGSVIIPTGGGNSNINALDAYEENTWIPIIAFGGASVGVTYGARTGNYTRVGRLIVANFDLALTAKGTSTGSVTIGGLPYVGLAGLNAVSITYWAGMALSAGNIITGGYMGASNGFTVTTGAAASANVNSLTDTQCTNTSRMIGVATYMTTT